MNSPPGGNRTVFLAGFLGLGVAAGMALFARGLAGDEEAFHYLVSRYAAFHPERLLDAAGHPLVTLVLALPAQFGLVAARLVSALATAMACAGVVLAARDAGLRSPWLAAPLLLLQPFFLAHAGTAMTEPWAAALVAWGLAGWIGRRWRVLTLCTALLPLVRLELAALALPVLARALRERRWHLPFLVAAPTFTWGLLGLMAGTDPLGLGDRTGWPSYPAREAWHYLRAFAWITGAGLAPLVVLGTAGALAPHALVPGDRAGAALRASATVLGIALLVYTLFATRLEVTFGNLRYFAFVAPAIALLGLGGVGLLKGRARWPVLTALALAGIAALTLWRHPWFRDFTPLERVDLLPAAAAGVWILLALLPAAARRVAPVLVLGFGLAILGRDHAGTLHLRPSPEHEAMRRMAEILPEDAASRAPLLSAHPLLALELELDPFDEARFPALDDTTLALAPSRTILVWDSHYAPARNPSLEPRALWNRPDWRYHSGVASSDSAFAAAFFLRPRAEDEGEVATFTAPPLPATRWLAAAGLARSGAVREEQVASVDARSVARWRLAAEANLRAGRPDRARRAWMRTRALAPGDPQVELLAAGIARQEGDADSALAAARRALDRAPDLGEAEFLVGALLAENGQSAQARPHLLRAATLLPQRWDVQYVAARILSLEGRWTEAREHFEAALSRAPRGSDVPYRAAEAAVNHRAPEDAERWLRQALETNPGEVRLHLMLVTLLADLGRQDEALLSVEQGLRATGGDPRLQNLRSALQR